MEKGKALPTSIDQYIAEAPRELQEKLNDLRSVIKAEVPNAEERIAYGMPTFSQQGNLVHFAACKNHVGFYPAPSGILAFQKELVGNSCSKVAIQLPLDRPLPVKLITGIVKFRVAENQEKALKKKR